MSRNQEIIQNIYNTHFDKAIEVAKEIMRLKEIAQDESDTYSREQLLQILDELERDMRELGINLQEGRDTLASCAA